MQAVHDLLPFLTQLIDYPKETGGKHVITAIPTDLLSLIMLSTDIGTEIKLRRGIPKLEHITNGDELFGCMLLFEAPKDFFGRFHEHLSIMIPVFRHGYLELKIPASAMLLSSSNPAKEDCEPMAASPASPAHSS